MQFDPVDPLPTVDDLEIESVSDSRLATWAEVATVFLLDFAVEIDDDLASFQERLEKGNGGKSAFDGRLTGATGFVGPAIGDDRDIGVDDAPHQALLRIRFSRAFSAATVSPNASPMKFFGQLRIWPKRSSSSGTSEDLPSTRSQK